MSPLLTACRVPLWCRPLAVVWHQHNTGQIAGRNRTPVLTSYKENLMARSGAVTFKGSPMTLAGEEVKIGQPAPDFTVHYFEGGLKTIKLSDLKGKPSIISVVPSLDTPVCQMQTKKFNEQLG